MRIMVLAIASLLALSAADWASAASKKRSSSNEFGDRSQCLGGACQAVNPDRIPSPQFSYRNRKTRKHKKETNE